MGSDATLTAIIAGILATLCVILVFAARRAMLRTGNRAIYFVMAAFATFAVKEFVKAFTLGLVGPESASLELVFTLFDTVAIGLFAWPILARGGAER